MTTLAPRCRILVEYAKWTARAAVGAPAAPISAGKDVYPLLDGVAFDEVLSGDAKISENEFNNYDLPWNPNRLEQRFGRIHRIGQTEVCHLWNLVADEIREGDVYRRLLEKLEQARQALGGQVFDVLGKLEFEGQPLRDLLLKAIRYGEQPEVRARLDTAVDQALDRAALQDLLEERQLVHDAMDATRVQRVREEMERAEARRLQPHYIESFFSEAFQRLGGYWTTTTTTAGLANSR